jgi:hypothetical protein
MDQTSTKKSIDEALGIVTELARKNPESAAARTVSEQLTYLKQAYERDGSLKSIPKGKMTIGVIAAREYDTAQPRLAELLYDIAWALDHDE